MGGRAKGGGSTTPAIEPVKSAEDAMKSASDVSARAQALRNGIASTFNRRAAFATPTAAATMNGATSGAASKLGG